MNEIARLLLDLLTGNPLNALVPISILVAIVIHVFLSEPIKELRERLLRSRPLKKEVEQLRAELVNAFRREEECKDRAATYRDLLEAAVLAKNAALWKEVVLGRKIADLELEIARLRLALAECTSPSSAFSYQGYYEI